MKNKKNLIIAVIFVIVCFLPLLMAFSLDVPIFSFSSGKVESWIGFWGSYIGALIGASVVYFVSQLQIKKQYEQQIEAIKIENEQSTKREMKKFYLTNKLSKLEEMLAIVDRLLFLIIDLNNNITKFSVLKFAFDDPGGLNANEDTKQKINKERSEFFIIHSESALLFIKLLVLSNYASDNTQTFIHEIQSKYNDVSNEIRDCIFDKVDYRQYLSREKHIFASDGIKIIRDELVELNTDILQFQFKNTINEIENYSGV